MVKKEFAVTRKFMRFIRTAKDLKPTQIAARIVLVGKRKLRRLTRARVGHVKLELKPTLLQLKTIVTSKEKVLTRSGQALQLEFEFLNRKVRFHGKIDWNCPEVSRLWRFNLHYCSGVIDLAEAYRLTGKPEYLTFIKQLIRSWISENSSQSGDAWHPYTISLRVSNWMLAVSKVWDKLSGDEPFCRELLGSLREQLIFLKFNLEFDTRGNHLFENAKALILGGVFFGKTGQGARLLTAGQRLLDKQLAEQILPDGGHFERSPMYHCIVLEGMLILFEVLRGAGIQPSETLASSIGRMSQFLKTIRLPDGNYPLFNDSAEQISLTPDGLINWAETLLGPVAPPVGTGEFMESSGYARLEDAAGDVIIFDCGTPCPPFLPGHAHADTLGFEWRLGNGIRVFVDPGVFEYEAGPWRDYFRGTSAHNTIQIDGRNSTEVWGSFRAARKARIRQSGYQRTEQWTHVFAEHDGFVFLPGKPVHRRDLFYLFDDGVLLVWDTVTGSGRHQVESRLHLDPVWKPEKVTLNSLELVIPTRKMNLRFFKDGQLSIHQGEVNPIMGWYAPEFGQKVPAPCIHWVNQAQLPYQTGFICYPSQVNLDCRVDDQGIYLNSNRSEYVFRLESGTIKILSRSS